MGMQCKSGSLIGFKTTRTVVWCTNHTALCGPHRMVRTAPALKAQTLPHNHNFPTIYFNLFYQIFGEKKFQKDFKNFFFKILKKQA